ncbi:MAG: hypothetical protein ACMUIL_04385 [bacterium]
MSVSPRSFPAGVVIAANILLISSVHFSASILAQEYQVSAIKSIEEYTVPAFPNHWCMIGGCSRPAKPSVGKGMIKAVFAFSNHYDLLDRTALLQPGRGYWIHCSESTTLTVETGDE